MAGMGCAEQYNRHWHEYNDELVLRGSLLSDLSWVPIHNEEIRSMNEGKNGRPFRYGNALMVVVRRLRSLTDMAYRTLEGFLRPIFEIFGINVPDYSTLWRRCGETDVSAGTPADTHERIAAADSTGIKVTVRGEWMREKWKIHRGWLKLHVLTDIHTNEILSFVATDERSGDGKHLLRLVDDAAAAGCRIVKVLADGAYDAKDNWNGMKERKIEFVAKIRKNASESSSGGCMIRKMQVLERNAIGEDEWKKKHGYNMRWKVESAISDYKRMFGESVSSKTFDNMVKEISGNIECFNIMKRVAV